MPVEPIIITVTINGEILEVDQEEVTIDTEDVVVQWNFIGIPENTLGFVHFETANHEVFGPFQNLEPAATGVIATGNNGQAGTYEYTAMILGDEEAELSSTGTLSITNNSSMVNTTPHATVSYDPTAAPQDRVTINMPTLILEKGQTAFWHVTPENIFPNNFVTFHFDGYPATPMTGPFQSFSMSPGPDGALFAIGQGFSATSNVVYHIRVRNGQGDVLATSDPVIEPVGSPPGG